MKGKDDSRAHAIIAVLALAFGIFAGVKTCQADRDKTAAKQQWEKDVKELNFEGGK